MVISGSRNQGLDFESLHCAGGCKLVMEVVVEWPTWCVGLSVSQSKSDFRSLVAFRTEGFVEFNQFTVQPSGSL